MGPLADTLVYESDGLSEMERTEAQVEALTVIGELETRLSPLSDQIFRMRFFEAMSVPQIAVALGRSKDSVYMTLRRSRHLLTTILRQRRACGSEVLFEKIGFFERI
jgi:DNA-directed RNA polymerase specialized sigma24 family protein